MLIFLEVIDCDTLDSHLLFFLLPLAFVRVLVVNKLFPNGFYIVYCGGSCTRPFVNIFRLFPSFLSLHPHLTPSVCSGAEGKESGLEAGKLQPGPEMARSEQLQQSRSHQQLPPKTQDADVQKLSAC